ncbi:MAG: hypothetical protein JNJ55_08510 [Betaproteobacteria bacterium]|nr:hypothetical protein [Betaproteobacteria bacterium]
MKPNPITTMRWNQAAERKFAIACRGAYVLHTPSMTTLMLREQGDLYVRFSSGGLMHQVH